MTKKSKINLVNHISNIVKESLDDNNVLYIKQIYNEDKEQNKNILLSIKLRLEQLNFEIYELYFYYGYSDYSNPNLKTLYIKLFDNNSNLTFEYNAYFVPRSNPEDYNISDENDLISIHGLMQDFKLYTPIYYDKECYKIHKE